MTCIARPQQPIPLPRLGGAPIAKPAAGLALAIALSAMLAGCGGAATTARPQSAGSVVQPTPHIPPQRPAQRPISPDFRGARVMDLPGLEGVIGADANGLTRQFGAARLDVREGDVRKLQFSGTACVLDVYLYPPAQNAEPRATYVDARRASDGLDVDRAACVAALRQR